MWQVNVSMYRQINLCPSAARICEKAAMFCFYPSESKWKCRIIINIDLIEYSLHMKHTVHRKSFFRQAIRLEQQQKWTSMLPLTFYGIWLHRLYFYLSSNRNDSVIFQLLIVKQTYLLLMQSRLKSLKFFLLPQNRNFYTVAGSNARFPRSINCHYPILKGELREQDKFSQGRTFERQEFWVLILFGWKESRGAGHDCSSSLLLPAFPQQSHRPAWSHRRKTQLSPELRHLTVWDKRKIWSWFFVSKYLARSSKWLQGLQITISLRL